MLVSGTLPRRSLSLSPNPFRNRMIFETQPKEGAIQGEEQQAPYSLPGAGPALPPKLAAPLPSGEGDREGSPAVRRGASQGMRGGREVAFASLGGNHGKQTLSSLARSLEYQTSRPGGWSAGPVPGGLGVTRSPPEVLSRGGMIHKCLRDRLDFLEILQSGDTSIPIPERTAP